MPGSDIDKSFDDLQEEANQRRMDDEETRQKTLRQMELNRENERKKEAALKIFDQLNTQDTRIQNIENQIAQLPNIINQSIQNAFSQIQQPVQSMATNPMGPIDDPMVKANVLATLAPAAAELIKLLKGGNAPAQDYFGDMSKEITMNMLRAGVDGIMQNVYHNYNPIPPKNSWQQAPPDERHRLQ